METNVNPSKVSQPGQGLADGELVKLCAWCPDADLVAELFRREGIGVTHGICHSCCGKVMRELDAEFAADIENIEVAS